MHTKKLFAYAHNHKTNLPRYAYQYWCEMTNELKNPTERNEMLAMALQCDQYTTIFFKINYFYYYDDEGNACKSYRNVS